MLDLKITPVTQDDKPKAIAFYLPQFHQIPENDIFWGKGFTEWTNTRKSLPLFSNHYQPREPLNDNYYDLSDPAVMKCQSKTAKDYGLYGFCFYHYWFRGRKILERPIEKMLTSSDIQMPYCLSWANESWTRTWSGREQEFLLRQEYGEQEDWEKHFYYLLQFFQDSRYIRVNNKPLFLIYRSESIPDCDKMLACWDKLAKENGLEGLYLVSTLNVFEVDSKCHRFDAKVEFEPMYTLAHHLQFKDRIHRKTLKRLRSWTKFIPYFRGTFIDSMHYARLWELILERTPSNEVTFPGAFIDWDNSPRRGFRSFVVKGANPIDFEKYFKRQCFRAKEVYKSPFIFINAWNEWAEGAYLEPDKRFGYAYLEALSRGLSLNA